MAVNKFATRNATVSRTANIDQPKQKNKKKKNAHEQKE